MTTEMIWQVGQYQHFVRSGSSPEQWTLSDDSSVIVTIQPINYGQLQATLACLRTPEVFFVAKGRTRDELGAWVIQVLGCLTGLSRQSARYKIGA